MSVLEMAFRVAAFTQLCILSLFLFRYRLNKRNYRYAALLALGISAYTLAPLAIREWQWGVAGYPIILLAIVVPALFWYFTSAVFDDDFVPPRRSYWLITITTLVGFSAFCTGSQDACEFNLLPIPDWIAQMVKLLWIAAAIVPILKDWQADLVESRRRLRLLIVLAVGCYMSGIVMVELFLASRVTAAVELVNVTVLLLAVTAFCLHILDINNTNVFARIEKPPPQSPQASPLARELVTLMENGRAFALDPLSIKILADRLRTQPYLLRQVINGELGYRNFNAFINLYRVKEVAHRLSLPEYRNTPLLTLALDAGFRSLAPFNRSFKTHYGVTPSEYRHSSAVANNA